MLSHLRLAQIKNSFHWLQNGQWQTRVLTQNDYTHDAAGLRLTNQLSDQNGPVRTESYGYDGLNRLTGVNYGDGEVQSYTFDPMGNRLTKVVNGSSEGYTYNNANMLLTRGANNYTNDANGNTLTGGGRTNVWDSQNRMASSTFNGTTNSFTYGADGLRRQSTVGANVTDYIVDNSMVVRERVNGSVSATHLFGPRGPEYRRDDQASTVRWYCYDGLGSVLGEVAPDGTLTRTQSFDVYGAVRTSNGVATSKHKFVASLGHPSDDETGLVYMRARWMDPVTGRFVSEDPKQDGGNWYAYAASDPVNATDPDGQFSIYGTAAALAWFVYLTYHFVRADKTNLVNDMKYAWGLVLTLLVFESFAPTAKVSAIIRAAREICEAAERSMRLPYASLFVPVVAGYGLFLLFACEWASDFEDSPWRPCP